MKDLTESLKTELKSIVNKVTINEKKNSKLEYLIKQQEEKFEYTNRRNNVIIYNLHFESDIRDDVETAVLKLFNEVMKTNIEISDIDYVRLLGKSKISRRPLLVKFIAFRTKLKLLKAAKFLKTSRIGVSQDFYKVVRDKRKFLFPYLKLAKSKNLAARLIHDKLLI